MTPKSANWKTIADSRFPWEQEALEFIRQQFPPYDTYQAWANLEFIALDSTFRTRYMERSRTKRCSTGRA